MAITLMMTISSLNDQYSCSSFYNSTYVDDNPCNIYSGRMPKCSLPSVASLIYSASMESGIFMHGSLELMVIHIGGISSSLFVSQVCLHSQSAMSSCHQGLYSILVQY